MIPTKEKRLLRVGILGCGPIAQFGHLEAVQKARNAELYAVCDLAEDLVKKLGTFYEAKKLYTDYDAMLADPQVELVIIATADAFHIEAARRAVEAGKHVLVEKPLGISVENCATLVPILDKSPVVFQVAHMKRFDPGIAFAKRFVEEELGELMAYKGWYCDSTLRYDATDSVHPVHFTSKQAKKPKENPKADLQQYYMLAHGSHLVDLAYFLAGEIVSVQAHLRERAGMYSWFVDTEFASGSNGHLDLTVAIRDDWHEGFHIYGTGGTVLGKIHNPWYFKPAEVRAFSQKNTTYIQNLDNNAHAYKLQVEAMAGTILHGEPQIGTTLQEGITVVKTMAAINESVRTGERILVQNAKGNV